MRKLLKPIIAALIMGALALLVFPQWAAWALPNSGHARLSTTTTVDSGPPDLARSEDPAETYTAIVWAEGESGVGTIQLAYSDVSTKTRTWTRMVVDSNGSNPALAFDPITKTLVHLVYEKGTGFTGITYAKCTLGVSCVTQTIETTATGYHYTTPQIVVNTSHVPVMVYSRTPKFSDTPRLFAAYIGSGGSVTKFQIGQITPTDYERNPTMARGGSNKIHVAYAADTDLNGSTDYIKYLRLGGATTITTEETSVAATFKPDPASAPNFPAIVVLSNTVSLVWQMTYDADLHQYVLGYNTNTNNGVTANWSPYNDTFGYYRYILSNGLAKQSVDYPLSVDLHLNSKDPDGPFRGGLRPDVMLSADGRTRVVWQEEVNNDNPPASRLDIMYTYLDAGQWRGTPILTLTTMPISYTNVTTVYGQSEYNKEGLGAVDKARAKVVFGEPGNRAQIVYMSGKVGVWPWQVRYNGWQEGNPILVDPTLRFKNSDADTLPDTTELLNTPVCTGTGRYQYDANGDSTPDYAYNCNFNDAAHGSDDVPDFMDDNSDGDYLPDDRDPQPRVYNAPGGLFLPIILKNR